jgi:DNA polymerase III subunit gamma/tau
MNPPTELYKKYRPKILSDVVGQDSAISVIRTKLEKEEFPHVTMFTGPTGVGKTSIAAIIAQELGCTPFNLTEVNCGEARGINVVREIDSNIHTSPLGGKCKVYIMDEVVQFPKATQQAFLRTLENVPNHVYFIFCTSETANLLPTFMGRCFQIGLKTLEIEHLEKIITRVLLSEQRNMESAVLHKIMKSAQGSGRKALQLLEAALTADNQEDQLLAISLSSGNEEEAVEFLAKALMGKMRWIDIAKIIKRLDGKDVESLRYQVLAYAAAVMLNKPSAEVYFLIRCFEDSYTLTGKAGMLASCWRYLQGGKG